MEGEEEKEGHGGRELEEGLKRWGVLGKKEG